MKFKSTKVISAGLLALLNAGCPEPTLKSISLPGEFGGVRATDVYEDEVQKAPHERKLDSKGNTPGVYEFNMLPGFEGQRFAPVVTFPGGDNGERAPFMVSVNYNVNHDGSYTGGKVILTDFVDNPNTPENEDVWFSDGLPVNVYLQGAAFIGSGRSTDVEHFEFNYKYGRSTGQLTHDIDTHINTPVDQAHPPAQGNGNLNTNDNGSGNMNGNDNGSGNMNGNDNHHPPANNNTNDNTTPGFVPGDGACQPQLGENWMNSRDCPIPDSAFNNVAVRLYDGNREITEPVYNMAVASAARDLNVRVSVSATLADALAVRGLNVPTPTVRDLGYTSQSTNYDGTNNPDCFFSANASPAPIYLGESGGMRTWRTNFNMVHSGCNDLGPGYSGQFTELVEAKADFSGGRVYTDNQEFHAQ